MLDGEGLRVRRNARVVTELADALVGLRRVFGPDVVANALVPYLDAMRALANRNFGVNRHPVTNAASGVVAAAYAPVLWEPILLLLRRMAHEHVAAETLGTERRLR